MNEIPGPGRERDALVAHEVRAWPLNRVYGFDYMRTDDGDMKVIDTEQVLDEVPHDSTDIAAAFEMEEEIIACGLLGVYAMEVRSVLLERTGDHSPGAVLHASPDVRTLAALRVVERCRAPVREVPQKEVTR